MMLLPPSTPWLWSRQSRVFHVVSRGVRTNTHLRRGGGGSGGGSRNRQGFSGGNFGGIPPYLWVSAAATGGIITVGYFAFLNEAPLTKRRRWIATSPEWESRLGDEQYKQLRQQYRGQILDPQHRASRTVGRVGSRIAEAARSFCSEHSLQHVVSSKPYTFTVVRSDEANAFVLPGNHVFVLTGLFRYVRSEDELAAVLGHEAAHTLARHAGERMSGGIVVNTLAQLLFLLDPSGIMTTLFLPAANLLSTLPHSREAESEADQIGLYLASKACYDPRAAKRVFQAMKEGDTVDGKGRGTPPQFLLTHPSHDRRIAQLDEWIPDALEAYTEERCGLVRYQMAQAREQAAIIADRQEQKQTNRQQPEEEQSAW